MEERDIAIKIEKLRKRYRLGTIGGGTLKGDLESWWARKRGKEDPNSKIDAKQHTKNEIFYALDGIDLTIYKGERIGIIGHNGAGKSTLLKLLSRVTAPTEGRIYLDGRIASMLEVGTGFNGELTGRENVYLNGAILGMTKAEVDAKMEQIIDFSEVRQFIDTPVKRYSSGMYVKLAFSVAAHLDSEIMIMDEVLAVGDMAFQKKCLTKMREVSEAEGRTVLYVSHNMNTIRQLCERCIVLDHGKVAFEGDVEGAIENYNGMISVTQKHTELRNINRKSTTLHSGFSFVSLTLADRESAMYKIGEKIEFLTKQTCEMDIDDLLFRIIIYYSDGSAATMITTERGIKYKANEINNMRFIVDTSKLAPGSYTLKLCAYVLNGYGSSIFYDVVDEGIINFEVVAGDKFNNGMVWNHNWWGHIVSEPLEVCIENAKC